MARLQVEISDDLADRFRAFAVVERVSRTFLVELALEELLERGPVTRMPSAGRRPAPVGRLAASTKPHRGDRRDRQGDYDLEADADDLEVPPKPPRGSAKWDDRMDDDDFWAANWQVFHDHWAAVHAEFDREFEPEPEPEPDPDR